VGTGRTAWQVLDTAFGDGSNFLACWQHWRDEHSRPTLLHYVGLLPAVPDKGWPHELAPLCAGVGPGFHRLLLQDGQVSLTLCIGPLQAMLSELAMQADTVFLGASTDPWDKWAIKALARLCRRGTQLVTRPGSNLPRDALEDAGFRTAADSAPAIAGPMPPSHFYEPRWNLAHNRKGNTSTPVKEPARCAVVGAGLAGASVAHALAVRGWQVTVLDQHPGPAGGASGLPVGLVVPHVSADDSPRSRMSRSGTRLMLHHARRLLTEGEDWAPSGVLEHRDAHEGDLWHPMAGWIKPARLVQAWMNHPGIRFMGDTAVVGLRWQDGTWCVQGDAGQALARAEHVVLANGFGCQALLHSLAGAADLEHDVLPKAAVLQELHGTLSYGPCPAGMSDIAGWPRTPVNGNGSFIPAVPSGAGLHWYAGSTFETKRAAMADLPTQHLANQLHLRALLPAVEAVLAPAFDSGAVASWSSTRCVTHDRLPLVGPLQAIANNSLWICAGMGARGLSFSALCAELLAAQLHGEPLPVEASLARGLSALRPRRKRSQNQTF